MVVLKIVLKHDVPDRARPTSVNHPMSAKAATTRAQTTRDHIVEAADELFYAHGFANTSFADIAEAVGISRGNFYYHFKTKDEILEAVIALRLANTRRMLDEWNSAGDSPAARIRCFVHILIANQAKIMLQGCPVGTLSSELAKLEHGQHDDATQIFMLFRTWLKQQFSELGCGKDADAHAMHVLAHSQGVATLANAFHDEAFVAQEVARIGVWLDTIVSKHTSAARKAAARQQI